MVTGYPLKKIACVGGSNMDIQGFSSVPINMRDSNPGSVRLCPGGVCRNIAENLARLGAAVTMISAVGNDYFGQMILKCCMDAGIDISGIDIVPDARSSSYLVLTDTDGDMLAAISDMHIIKQLGADFILRHADILDQADVIVLDPNLSPEALEALTSGWSDKPICADPISTAYARVLREHLSRLSMVKCNLQEAEIFADMVITGEKDQEKAADRILEAGTGCIVITSGKHGVFYKDRNGLKIRKQHQPLKPVSATGAGDAFTAGMVYGFTKGMFPDDSLELAMRAAEITLMDPLTVSPEIGSITQNIKIF